MGFFAVIDTETNWYNEVMSIGIVIADQATFQEVDILYYVFDPEYRVGGMYSMVLSVKGKLKKEICCPRKKAMEEVRAILMKYDVKQLFAYNASFDKNLLGELSLFTWFDIMKVAAYKQYNHKIPDDVECCKTGKMKRDYGVEPMMRLLSGNQRYTEVHNAICDAIDELEIMRLLEKPLEEYSVARI